MLEKQYVRFKSGEWQAGPNNLYSGNFSLRKEHLIAVGGFDVGFVRQEDVELGFRLEKHGLHFLFVAEADGWHRPTRTWQSWYTTPHTYGIRDVQMARDKGVDQAMALARKHYAERNAVTRSLAKICVGGKLREAITFGAMVPLIHLSDRIGLRTMSLALCSLVFNLRYFQGMSQEMGGARQMWTAIAAKAGS